MAADELILYLQGGLNTANDPSSIDDNEFAESSGMEFHPPRMGLFATSGRRVYSTQGAFGANDVHGLVYCDFDGVAGQVVAFAGTVAYSAPIQSSATATFTSRKTGLTDLGGVSAYAEGIHYNNIWFFFNGQDSVWALKSDLTTIIGGLVPTTATATITTATGGGLLAGGVYNIWWTEYDATNDLESAYTGATQSYTITSPNNRFTFVRPTQVNSQATQWRVYMGIAGQLFPYGAIVVTASAFAVTSAAVSAEATTTPYSIVTPPGGVAVSARRNLPAVVDMALFQDSFAFISTTNRQQLGFTLPDSPFYVPSINYVPFETEWQDELTALEVCNNSLLVFTTSKGYRLDDLPRHTDSEDMLSSRGRAKEPFSNFHGCVSPRGSAVFSIFGSGELCLFVCRDGIHITDGFKTDYASCKLDWNATVDVASLSSAVLKNNPAKHRVEFTYIPAGGPALLNGVADVRRLDFYYHPSFLIPPEDAAFPRLPILGPSQVPGVTSALALLDQKFVMLAASNNTATGSVWLEGTGTADDANLTDSSSTINKRWKTKDFYMGGVNGEFEISRVFTHQSQTTASGSGTLTASYRIDYDANDYTATSTFDQSKKNAQPHFDLQNRAQAFSLRGVKDDGGTWQELNYIVLVTKGASKLMPGKSSV
jgi:hypothetical protein